MTKEQLKEEKTKIEAELAANTEQRKQIKKRLAAIETLAGAEAAPAAE